MQPVWQAWSTESSRTSPDDCHWQVDTSEIESNKAPQAQLGNVLDLVFACQGCLDAYASAAVLPSNSSSE